MRSPLAPGPGSWRMEFSNGHLFRSNERDRYRHAWLEHSVQSRTSQSDLLVYNWDQSQRIMARGLSIKRAETPLFFVVVFLEPSTWGSLCCSSPVRCGQLSRLRVQAQPVMFQGHGTGPVAPGSRLPGRWEREEDPWGCARGGPWPPSFRCCLGHCSGSKLCLPLTPAL
jgi:hypothetical protein